MKVIVCIDDNNGLMFNNRRQSRDALLVQDIMGHLAGSTLFVSEYSGTLFESYRSVIVNDLLLEIAEEDDFCFIEDKDVSEHWDDVSELIVYRWNRTYPADTYFSFPSGIKLIHTSEFVGISHEKITKEVYFK